MTESSKDAEGTTGRKPVPHVALLPKNPERFRQVLGSFVEIAADKELAVQRLESVLGIKKATSRRMVESLLEFGFLKSEEGGIHLSNQSASFMDSGGGAQAFAQLVRQCLSTRTEWESFITDLEKLIGGQEGGLNAATILTRLQANFGYAVDQKSKSYLRYLSDGLKLLEYADILAREGRRFTLAHEVTPELKRELGILRARVLNILRKADRRRVRAATMRRLYQMALTVYLSGRQRTPRGALRILDEAQKIEATEIRQREVRRRVVSEMEPWSLSGFPYPWQIQAFKTWMRTRKGIAKVVTGAGKTRLALMIVEELHRERRDLQVSIVVPTIVLMRQWVDFLEQELHVPPEQIGLRGGGYKGSHREGFPVVIYVINSAIASELLLNDTVELGNHLLIVDECHRAGAEKFRKIFDSSYNWSLGLSATPQRERDQAFEQILVPRLGPVIIEVTYEDARNQGIIPDFEIENLAVALTPMERESYDSFTREIRDLLRDLKGRYHHLFRENENLDRALHVIQKAHPGDRAISLYFQKTMARKREVLYPASNRYLCVRSLLRRLPDGDRTIIFHESIDRINALFKDLARNDVAVYHSQLPESLLAIGMSLYRRGVVHHLLSVKALIEGVDIPSTNVGIIMASSASTTQRVQSLGRILRNAPGKDHTQLYTIYVKDTTDERVFHKPEWSNLVGAAAMRFRFWSRFGEVEIEPPQKKAYATRISERPETAELMIGSEYPGRTEGRPISLDSKGLVFVRGRGGERRYLENALPILRQWMIRYKPKGGRFLINEAGHIVTRAPINGRTRTLLVGILDGLPVDEQQILLGVIASH